jgi:LssY C-terminus
MMTCLIRFFLGLVPTFVVLFSIAARPATAQDFSYKISSSQIWTDTGLDLHAGDVLAITATATSSANDACYPNGNAFAAAQAGKLPMASALPGALIARVEENGSPQLVGSSQQLRAAEAGHLFLGINAATPLACQGSFAVKVHVSSGESASSSATTTTPTQNLSSNSTTPASTTTSPNTQAASGQAQTGNSSKEVKDVKGALMTAAQTWLSGQLGTGTATESATATSSSATPGAAATPTNATAGAALSVSTAPLDSKLRGDIDTLPRRVSDQFKNQGDMLNFILVGSQKKLQDALTAADWHLADRDVNKSIVQAAIETYQKQAYLTMPMSDLYLFGRVQDFGYEQAEAYAVVASRHHFRIWKTSFKWDGEDVWAGAGTHDIGFEKDQRNGKVTHKIDPAVDGERDHIASTLQQAGQVKSLTYYLPPDPVQDARNATGGGYHSDGRIIVIVLK